ncbi:MAG: MBG domain-containing protein [Candidatus Bipolaricaulota bacterium]
MRQGIHPTPLTITADDQEKVYGEEDPEFTVTYEGFWPGDGPDDVRGLVVTREQGEQVGTYTITPSGARADKYRIFYESGTLEITECPIEVSAVDQEKEYGKDDPYMAYEVTEGTLAFDDMFTGELERVAGEDVDTYAILQGTLSIGNIHNYELAFIPGTLTINKATASVTADNREKTYGEDTPTLTATVVGEVEGGDAIDYSLSTTAEEFSDVGDYDIMVTVGSNPNYDVTRANATLRIVKADAIVDVGGGTWTYDGTTRGAAGTAIGAVDEDLTDLLYLGESYANVPGGPVSWSFPGDRNHHPDSGSGTVRIRPRSIEITAHDQHKAYGDEDPRLTWEITEGGLVADDEVTGGFDREDGEGVGTYLITQGSLDINDGNNGSNYYLTVVGGALELTPAPLTITADDKEKTFDEHPFTDFTVSYEGFVAGEGPKDLGGTLTFGGTAVGAVDAGTCRIVPGGLTSTNYRIDFVSGRFTILPHYDLEPAGVADTFMDRAVVAGAGTSGGRVVEVLYEIGTPIIASFSVRGFYGEQLTDARAVVGLFGAEGDPEPVVYLGMAPYDEEVGLYHLEIPTDGLQPGLYFLDITLNEGSHSRELLELVEPSAKAWQHLLWQAMCSEAAPRRIGREV